MFRHPTVVVALFLAAGCEHSGSVDAPSTPQPQATSAPAVAERAPAPDVAEPAPAPAGSVAPAPVPALTDPPLEVDRAFYPPLVGRAGPHWAGKEAKPRLKMPVVILPAQADGGVK